MFIYLQEHESTAIKIGEIGIKALYGEEFIPLNTFFRNEEKCKKFQGIYKKAPQTLRISDFSNVIGKMNIQKSVIILYITDECVKPEFINIIYNYSKKI